MNVLEPIAELSQLANRQKEIIGELIKNELEDKIPEFEAKEAEAARKANAAYNELQPCLKLVQDLASEIEATENDLNHYQTQLTSVDRVDRANARLLVPVIADELDALQGKYQEAVTAASPYQAAHDLAKLELEAAQENLKLVKLNLDFPFTGFGQDTQAYYYRLYFGGILNVLLFSDEMNFEWVKAIEFLEYLCLVSGYRTAEMGFDGLLHDKLGGDPQRVADLEKQNMDEFFDKANRSTVHDSGVASPMVVQELAGDITRGNAPGGVNHPRPELNVSRVPEEYRRLR